MNLGQQSEIQNQIVYYDNIAYLINEEENTAGVFNSEGSHAQKIIIPRSIEHGSKKYDVTSILMNAFNKSQIEIILFASD